MKKCLYILFLLAFIGSSFTFNLGSYDIGSSISNIELTDVQGDSTWNLNALQDKKAVVLIFDANDCAYSNYYRLRILELHKKYHSLGVEIVLVNSFNTKYAPKESRAQMKMLATANNYPYAYLDDVDGKIANKFAAKKAPEAFLLKKEGKDFKLRYKGAIDNNPQVPSDVTETYLDDAIFAILKGNTPPKTSTFSIGCMIRK